MAWIVFKYLSTAAIVVLVSELAKRSDRVGAFVAALPIMTLLVLFWLHVERQPEQKLANHAYYTFWYVLPTLPMFYLFPILLSRFGFWGALGASAVLTAACFGLAAILLQRFGIQLL